MTKKGPLGKAEIFYVKGHYEKQEVAQIAKDLDRALSLIKKQVEIFESGKPKVRKTAGEQMARKKGIVVMTKTASQIGDDHRGSTSSKTSHCVTKIKND